jgi:hypothetical protein
MCYLGLVGVIQENVQAVVQPTSQIQETAIILGGFSCCLTSVTNQNEIDNPSSVRYRIVIRGKYFCRDVCCSHNTTSRYDENTVFFLPICFVKTEELYCTPF